MTLDHEYASHGFADVDQAAAAPGLFIDYLDRVRGVPTIGEIDRALRGLVAALEPRRIVEIGCGTGDLLAELCQAGSTPAVGLGIEKSARLAEEAAVRHSDVDGLTFLVHDFADDGAAVALAALGFAPASADAIVLNRVVQHLAAPLPLLRNALPLLRPGGQVIISDVDWTTLRLDLPDRETGDKVVAEHIASIITPDAGSIAGALLRNAGLGQVTLKVGIVHRIEDFELADHLFSLRAAAARLVERGLLSARTVERWQAEARQDQAFAAEVLQTIFIGTVPQRV